MLCYTWKKKKKWLGRHRLRLSKPVARTTTTSHRRTKKHFSRIADCGPSTRRHAYLDFIAVAPSCLLIVFKWSKEALHSCSTFDNIAAISPKSTRDARVMAPICVRKTKHAYSLVFNHHYYVWIHPVGLVWKGTESHFRQKPYLTETGFGTQRREFQAKNRVHDCRFLKKKNVPNRNEIKLKTLNS